MLAQDSLTLIDGSCNERLSPRVEYDLVEGLLSVLQWHLSQHGDNTNHSIQDKYLRNRNPFAWIIKYDLYQARITQTARPAHEALPHTHRIHGYHGTPQLLVSRHSITITVDGDPALLQPSGS